MKTKKCDFPKGATSKILQLFVGICKKLQEVCGNRSGKLQKFCGNFAGKCGKDVRIIAGFSGKLRKFL